MAVEDFFKLTDVEWRKKFESDKGLFVAEGAKVISRAWELGYAVREAVTTQRWLDSLPPQLLGGAEVHILSEDELEDITGFHVHRGALASFERRENVSPDSLLADARTVVVLDGLVDHENVGAIFRSAAGLGADCVLLTEDCADPLYRRSIKTSMGASLSLPFARVSRSLDAVDVLRAHSIQTIALSLQASDELSADMFSSPARRAFFFGSEGHGLSEDVASACDVRLKIPMHRATDSLNVAQAAAIVLWAATASL